jgi:DNA-binding response OmpR family regulator
MVSVKVLVIDDDPIVLEVVRERLSSAGHEVVTREEALGTTQVVRDEQPDLVLLDVMMPALNGERIAELLRGHKATQHVGIILHSSKSELELLALIQQTGALGAIAKTSNGAAFMQRFEALAQRHRKRSSRAPRA